MRPPSPPDVEIHPHIATLCATRPEWRQWLAALPDSIGELRRRWSLDLGAPYPTASCAWVAPAVRSDGTRAVLKVQMPHMEAADEIAGLRFWGGAGTVALIDADPAHRALLLERCEPGTPLREMPEAEQDVVIAGLLRRMWRTPQPGAFRTLAAMLRFWSEATARDAHLWPDPGLTREGLRLMDELSRPGPEDVLLATDLHAGNVLAARREPWLAIDPKPFVGDRAYDATQHLFNCKQRMAADPHRLIGRFADLLGVDAERVRLWTFARASAEPRDTWEPASPMLRALAP